MSSSTSDTSPNPRQHALDDLLGQVEAVQQEADHFFAGVLDFLEAAWRRDSAQRASTAASAVFAEKVETQLAGIERFMAEVRGTLDRQVADLSKPAAPVAPDPQLLQRLNEAQQQCGLLLQERAALETELEGLRNRVAEMTETLGQQKQQAQEQQSHWAVEFKRMRTLLEGVSRQIVQSGPAGSAPPAHPTASEAIQAGGGDPVLDCLATQFEMLQRDVSRRRSAIGQPRS